MESKIRFAYFKSIYADAQHDSTNLLVNIDSEKTFGKTEDLEKLISQYPFYYSLPFSIPILGGDPFYLGGIEMVEPERVEAISLHRNYLFFVYLNDQPFILKDENGEGYNINIESIEALELKRDLREIQNNPYSEEYVTHLKFFSSQLLELDKHNKESRRKFRETLEIKAKDGRKMKLIEFEKENQIQEKEIPDEIACERFRILRNKKIPLDKLEIALKEYCFI